MNLQRVEWNDENMQASVYDRNGNFVRSITYSNISEYTTCKRVYVMAYERGVISD